MKISKLKQITEEKEVIEDILCNKCGNTLADEYQDWYGIVEYTYNGGWSSSNKKGSKLHDLGRYTFSLCEPCMSTLFDSFKIPVEHRTIHGNCDCDW